MLKVFVVNSASKVHLRFNDSGFYVTPLAKGTPHPQNAKTWELSMPTSPEDKARVRTEIQEFLDQFSTMGMEVINWGVLHTTETSEA